jgi:hypothetical protein
MLVDRWILVTVQHKQEKQIMWYIQQFVFGTWNNSFSYLGDRYSTAKEHIEQLRARHPELQFRLICEDNF